MGKQKAFWSCQECGHRQVKWTGSCSICQKWNTFVEEVEISSKERFASKVGLQPLQPLRLHEIQVEEVERFTTQLSEFDRLLGGGVVPGSLILLGGDPGIGKSTLMLQIAQALSKRNLTILYICGEESVAQSSLRARRLQINSHAIFFYSETNFASIKVHIEKLKPHIVIVDSIQILYKSEIPSAPGSVTQVREITLEFMHLSKGLGISTFLIGHVTKSGEIAGPKVLEHLVDTVLEFEGDKEQGYRLLRSIKNRFGSTDEVAIYQMGSEGLKEVSSPSEFFLKERMAGLPGSVIIPTLEGSRCFLIEVQALVANSNFPTSTRRSAGLDQNRLALLLAVLEKRMGYQLYRSDIFVSVAGGMKIIEPAIDLGILLAISSSFCNQCIDGETIAIGEVGLGGEVRSVSRIENRLKEAIHMGFRHCLIPKRNYKGLPEEITQKINVQGVDFVEEAIDALLR